MGMIKELYDFVSEKGLELHTHVYNGQHRIVILWPGGGNHHGSSINLEVCEADNTDWNKAAEEAFKLAVKRYDEIIANRKKKEEVNR